MNEETKKSPTVPFFYQGKQCGEYDVEKEAAHITDSEVMEMLKKEQSKQAHISVGYRCTSLGEPDLSPTQINLVSFFDKAKDAGDLSSEE